jgi:hypothetical protein
MNLQLTPMRFEKVLDRATMLDYLTNDGKNVVERNRLIFNDSVAKEIRLNGYFFNYYKYEESGQEFAVLQPYQLNASPMSKRTYCFGCIDTVKEEASLFFKGKKMASDRLTAIVIYNELKKYLEPQPDFLPFSIKF